MEIGRTSPGFPVSPGLTSGPQFPPLQSGEGGRRSLGCQGRGRCPPSPGLANERQGCFQRTQVIVFFPAALQTGLHCKHFFITSRSHLNPANAQQGLWRSLPPGLLPTVRMACAQVQLQVVLCRRWGRAGSAWKGILGFWGFRPQSSVILFILKYPLPSTEYLLCARHGAELFTHISLFHPRTTLVLLSSSLFCR